MISVLEHLEGRTVAEACALASELGFIHPGFGDCTSRRSDLEDSADGGMDTVHIITAGRQCMCNHAAIGYTHSADQHVFPNYSEIRSADRMDRQDFSRGRLALVVEEVGK